MRLHSLRCRHRRLQLQLAKPRRSHRQRLPRLPNEHNQIALKTLHDPNQLQQKRVGRHRLLHVQRDQRLPGEDHR